MGNIGSHVNITSGRQRHQVKNKAPANIPIISKPSKRTLEEQFQSKLNRSRRIRLTVDAAELRI
jgi:hypothetical protein